mgnify:CR=1 FL=1
MKVYRATCTCGWVSAWAFNRELIDTEATNHQNALTGHLTYVSWGQFTKKGITRD